VRPLVVVHRLRAPIISADDAFEPKGELNLESPTYRARASRRNIRREIKITMQLGVR